jgi:hypothetical protein
VETRFFPLFVLAPFVCNCDPVFDMSGSVHRTDGTPVAGATVGVHCGAGGGLEAITDDNGKFEGNGVAEVSDECTGKIFVEGELTQEFDPIDYCVEGDSDECRRIEAKLTIPYPDAE